MSSSVSHSIPSQVLQACHARRQRVATTLATKQIDALLVSDEKDIHYLTGFIGHDSLLMLSPDGALIVSDPRYDQYLQPWRSVPDVTVVMGKRHRLADSIKHIVGQRNLRRLGIQAEHLTLAAHGRFSAVLGEGCLVPTQNVVSDFRRRKDDVEIAIIERAIHIQQEALHAALKQIKTGMREIEFSAILEYEIKTRGSIGSGFTPIIGAGPNSAIPHHVTGETLIEPGVFLVDWGAAVDGYNGDLTRTFALGEFPPKIREIYKIVLEAQLAAIAAIAPGRICADIDAIARNIITKAGYGEYFNHGLGHGLGMAVHEAPFFNDLETSTRLEPGMIMTVEPGIYLPGIGGVRIEDDVLITDNGCRVLSNFPKDLDAMTLDVPAKSKGQTTKVQREPLSTRT